MRWSCGWRVGDFGVWECSCGAAGRRGGGDSVILPWGCVGLCGGREGMGRYVLRFCGSGHVFCVIFRLSLWMGSQVAGGAGRGGEGGYLWGRVYMRYEV